MLTSIQLRCKSQKHHIFIDPHKPHKYKLTQIPKIFKGPLTLTHKTKSYLLTPAHTQKYVLPPSLFSFISMWN